ncbi:MAG: MYXO-CTERM sorting domain-containing protein [Kofleriaceae bacterium]
MKKLLMLAVAGVLPAAFEGDANADVRTATTTKVIPAPLNDKAPVSGTPARLRRTNEEQPGNEMPTLAFFKDGKSGLYFSMNTELNGTQANHRMQLALVPFTLEQDPTTGAVSAKADLTKAKFVTNNDGNEYRNANHPNAYAINGGNAIAVEYNYQPDNSNDTKRYLQVFDATGKSLLGQTQIYAKNNDDCSMNEDDKSTTLLSSTGGKNKLAAWRGCNGNGRDDGWVQSFEINCDAEAATPCSFKALADVSVCPREERSHGAVSFASDDPNTVIATWTEGNNQPQRDGTWMAAIDVSGNNANILWKEQIEGRKDIDGLRTYSMRAMQSRIQTTDANGNLVNTDMIIWRSGDLRGNNNTNGKGGTYYRNQMAVIKANKDGMSYVTPMTNVAGDLLGLDGTHLGMQFALFGTDTAPAPGVTFLSGSHTGGGYGAQVRAVTWNQTANKFENAGMYNIAPYDRHLYPNYTGNNPGNQGRNYANGTLIKNPFAGQNGNTDANLMVFATTGKDPADMMKPEIKLSAYISVLPISQMNTATPPGQNPGMDPGQDPGQEPGQDPGQDNGESGGNGDGTGNGNGNGNGGGDAGASVGGCATSNTSTGLASFLLIGLAALLRRRRR